MGGEGARWEVHVVGGGDDDGDWGGGSGSGSGDGDDGGGGVSGDGDGDEGGGGGVCFLYGGIPNSLLLSLRFRGWMDGWCDGVMGWWGGGVMV